MVGELDQRLTTQINQERWERERQYREVSERINAIVADERRRDELARSWVNDVAQKAEFIGKNYRHEQFAPGELAKIEREIQDARQSLGQGMPQSALSTVQRTYNELNDLQMKLEQMEKEWLIWQTAALETTRQILALAQENRACAALDLEGKPLEGFEVEVNYWTGGKLSALEGEISAVIGRVQEEGKPLSIEELREITEESAPELRKKLEEVIGEARTAVISSQMRASIADMVIEALESQGYLYDDSTYEGEDEREGYVAKAKAFDDSEVVISIQPDRNRVGDNQLQIHSFDEDIHNEYELLERAKVITKSLQGQGLQTSEPVATGEQADYRFQNMERVRQGATIQAKG